MKKFKVYLFDFDGTLVNSYNSIRNFYQYCFNPFNIKLTKEIAYKFSKVSFEECFNYYIKDKSRFKEFQNRAFEIVSSGELLKDIYCFPETKEILRYIEKNDITIGLVTGNDIEHVKRVFQHLKIPDIFRVKICYRDIVRQKPSPDGILKAIKKLNYTGDFKDICYIGDSYNDFLAAKNAGISPILLDRFGEFPDSIEYTRINNLKKLFN